MYSFILFLNFYAVTNVVSKKWGKKIKNPTNKPKPIFPFLCVEQNAFYLPTVPHPHHPWVDLEFNDGTKT